MKAGDQYHTGVVVDDFDGTLARLTALFGYEWGRVISYPTEMRFPDGTRTVQTHLVYSKTLPRVEIVQSIPGTLWNSNGSAIHHYGYWSDDVVADGAEFAAQGFAEEVSGLRPDGTAVWAYWRHPGGIRIELVARDLQPSLEQAWA